MAHVSLFVIGSVIYGAGILLSARTAPSAETWGLAPAAAAELMLSWTKLSLFRCGMLIAGSVLMVLGIGSWYPAVPFGLFIVLQLWLARVHLGKVNYWRATTALIQLNEGLMPTLVVQHTKHLKKHRGLRHDKHHNVVCPRDRTILIPSPQFLQKYLPEHKDPRHDDCPRAA
jgi:hypothetical protein